MKVGLTHGVFDLLHAGHMEHLRQCALMCDRLIVSLCRQIRKKGFHHKRRENKSVSGIDGKGRA